MHIHILGVGGTFMGGLAVLASELKLKVSGSDLNIYPPMSTQLEALKIPYHPGFDDAILKHDPDLFVVGNVMKRTYPIIETILDQSLPMMSGPEWLAKYVLQKRHVLAVSGTHGKTTTSSMLAWILEVAGLNPGFLIGGIPNNFEVSARLGTSKYFVVEADEYDSAFFDKRSKFVHYFPHTLIINNLEFDHADIFKDLEAIQTQFHHLIRTIPENGRIIYPSETGSIDEVLNRGLWTPTVSFGFNDSDIEARNQNVSGSFFEVYSQNKKLGEVQWSLIGVHNILNALAAIAAAQHIGIPIATATQALCTFKGVKRRLEMKAQIKNMKVYDDFAHHPTAIKTTLQGLRAQLGLDAQITAVVDLRSNTMRKGSHKDELLNSFSDANTVYFYKSEDILWDVEDLWQRLNKPGGVYPEIEVLRKNLLNQIKPNDSIIFMSNGGFSNIQEEVIKILKQDFFAEIE